MAWLHATPEKADRSRWESLDDKPGMPEIEWGQHLIDALLELGPPLEPVTYQEIEAWARVTRTHLPGYEALLLRELSFEYCLQLQASRKENCPMPGQTKEQARDQASQSFARTLANLKAAK